ncbi:MAG: hypothetical protein C0510_00040 [Erythrobacter sp.]|nr:hypothetical protein [Erythrobacter sp.]MBA4163013.1 hypothetical protein [Erythrobacter sp.]
MKSKFLTSLTVAVSLAAAGTGLISTAAMAVVPDSPSAVNTDVQGLALHGYDAVAYFTDGKPTKGNAKFKATYEGATYYFASEENQRKFNANPAAYAPQFGGFCAMGVALEKKLDGDPNVWKIVDGKLYLNVNQDVAVAWNRDIPGNLDRAEENWPAIKDATPESLN